MSASFYTGLFLFLILSGIYLYVKWIKKKDFIEVSFELYQYLQIIWSMKRKGAKNMNELLVRSTERGDMTWSYFNRSYMEMNDGHFRFYYFEEQKGDRIEVYFDKIKIIEIKRKYQTKACQIEEYVKIKKVKLIESELRYNALLNELRQFLYGLNQAERNEIEGIETLGHAVLYTEKEKELISFMDECRTIFLEELNQDYTKTKKERYFEKDGFEVNMIGNEQGIDCNISIDDAVDYMLFFDQKSGKFIEKLKVSKGNKFLYQNMFARNKKKVEELAMTIKKTKRIAQ